MDMLRDAGLKFRKANRLDICMVENFPIALVFLPAADIPRFVSESYVDIGITGQDMIQESDISAAKPVTQELPLGFGRCELQIQVPKDSQIKSAEDLAGQKIATSFNVVVAKHFGGIDKNKHTTIVYMGGSVETACTLGLAQGIVDLVESGESMRAAGLKPIGRPILSTEAVLITSSGLKDPDKVATAKTLKSRLAAVITSSTYLLCRYNISQEHRSGAEDIIRSTILATRKLENQGDRFEVSCMVEREKAATVLDDLQAKGAQDIIMTKIENPSLA
ncbi:ATP phosphoribosyltransferase (ATP-PRTase) (ATP-PRT) [Ceratobasidium sp. 428]|nr:ATP phosphoribosyltransferase (ATP-PRTase) (ATP-PRT) [Ceratobasidium sp. 428]